MQPVLLIHGYSAESKRSTADEIAKIYGTLPADLRAIYGEQGVFELDVSRYVSLEDGMTVDDVSYAMDRALRGEYSHLLASGFSVIIHSTGALVARNWIRRFSPEPSPISHLIYLAGANHGSGWAHIGKGQLAKWARAVFQGGAERGVRVLDWLELASSDAVDLHLHFLQDGQRMFVDYGVREFCIVGSQVKDSWLPIPIRYSHEDGADGVVRVSACDLNLTYLRIEPTVQAREMSWEDINKELRAYKRDSMKALPFYELTAQRLPGEPGRPVVPLAIPFECAHSGDDLGVVTGSQPRTQVLQLLQTALAVETSEQYEAARQTFDELTGQTYDSVRDELGPGWVLGFFREPRQQYDAHAQVVFRIFDQDGQPVDNFDIHFNSGEVREAAKKNSNVDWRPIGSLLEDKHLNDKTPNTISFYWRVSKFDADTGLWINEVKGIQAPDGTRDRDHPGVGQLHLDITATEPETDDILYLPLRVHMTNEELCEVIAPHRTTIVDVRLQRIPSPKVFVIKGA